MQQLFVVHQIVVAIVRVRVAFMMRIPVFILPGKMNVVVGEAEEECQIVIAVHLVIVVRQVRDTIPVGLRQERSCVRITGITVLPIAIR